MVRKALTTVDTIRAKAQPISRCLLAGLVALMTLVPLHGYAESEGAKVEYKDGSTPLVGYLVTDKNAAGRPGIVIVPEWWGVNDYVRARAKQLADLGYVTLVADIYGNGSSTMDPKEAAALSKPFYEDRALFRRRVNTALELLKKQKGVDGSKVAALGYCFGGTGALELARSGAPIKAAISFHGGLKNPHPEDTKNITADVLILNGEIDTFVPVEERQAFKEEMSKDKKDFTFIDFSGAQHAFTNPAADSFHIPGIGYNRRADHESWSYMRAFLNKVFQ